MPDPAKKIMVKIPKVKDIEDEEAKKGIKDVETAAENKLELTEKYSEAKEDMKKNLEKSPTDVKDDKTQGISIEKSTMKATPKVFVRKVIKSGDENGSTKILSDDGKKVVYEGRNGMKATEDALKKNDSKTKDTNSRRENNSNYYNVNSGAKEVLNTEDKNTLVKLGKAKKVDS